jgi:hypothetical protein
VVLSRILVPTGHPYALTIRVPWQWRNCLAFLGGGPERDPGHVALERMVGRQALEIEFRKGALKNAPRPRSATTFVIAGPAGSASQKDAN